MYHSEYVTGVEETIRCWVFAICEPNTMKSTSYKAPFVIWITSEPMDPEEVHVLNLYAPRASHINMKDPEDFGIPIWMPFCTFFIFVTQGHNIWVCVYVDQVLHLMQVIGCNTRERVMS
jgi:hypothetical protein